MQNREENEKWRYALLNQLIAKRMQTRTFEEAEKALLSCGFTKKAEKEAKESLLVF
jgi:hypothetical protein